MKRDTTIVHAGIVPDPTTGSIIPPIYETATYVLDEVGRDKGFDYTRSSNPTRQVLEDNLAAIEGGAHGISFASGMSAVDSCLKTLDSGDHVVCTDDVYGGVTRLFNQVLSRHGIGVTYVDSSQPETVRQAVRPETRMLWIETPTNPLLKVTDLAAMAEIAREHDLIYAVDSTFATPIFLRPLEYGADIVMHSTTKYLSGHNQIIGGIVVTNREDIRDQLKFLQKSVGAVSSPFDWLADAARSQNPCTCAWSATRRMPRGLPNSSRRTTRSRESSIRASRSHTQHDIAKAQMSGFSGMISFELTGGIAAGKTLMNSVELCGLAESLGAVETMITHPATMTHVDVPVEERHARGLTDGLVRISVGIEDADDIIADLSQGSRQGGGIAASACGIPKT